MWRISLTTLVGAALHILCPFWREMLCLCCSPDVPRPSDHQRGRSQPTRQHWQLVQAWEEAVQGPYSHRCAVQVPGWVCACGCAVRSYGRSKGLPPGFLQREQLSLLDLWKWQPDTRQLSLVFFLTRFSFHKMELCLSGADWQLGNSCGRIMVPGMRNKSPFSLQMP